MKIQDKPFHRLFSKTMYKNLKLPLWEMTFTKDFITDRRGDLYPVITKAPDCLESIHANRYHVRSGTIERLGGSFFPYATYEITACIEQGACGFSFVLPTATASVLCDGQSVHFSCVGKEESIPCRTARSFTMIVSCRPSAFDVYFLQNGQPQFLHTFTAEAFAHSHAQETFQKSHVSVYVQGNVIIDAVESCIDCGISQADIRPIRFENGDVIMENGKVFLNLSVRMQAEMFQGIVSWIPGTSQFELTGALFYDSGDSKWCGDVAASILFNRHTNEWNLWVCSFAHDHILGHAAFCGDPRFGVNVVDITLMDKSNQTNNITDFVGFEGDEDPDFYFNEKEKKWYMAICRMDPSIKSYKYMFFRSDSPFEGYTFIGSGLDGAETGGSFVTVDDEKIFACGNDFNKRANYRIYSKAGMQEARFDFDDGGFRGWGTILPVTLGSRKRYFWLTFDRHNGSSYGWSYGNIYCFEA